MMHTFFQQRAFRMLATASVFAWVGLVAGQTAARQAKSTSDGIYSAAQAERGQKTYEATCAACHETAQFTGNDFFASWGGKPVFDLFDKMKTTMPEDNPGSLEPQQYADVVSYFLKLNKFPAGTTELTGDPTSLKGLLIDPKGT